MWRQYTYSQDYYDRQYYCSKLTNGCKARLKLGVDGNVESATGTHHHPPPVYARTSSGQMVKVG